MDGTSQRYLDGECVLGGTQHRGYPWLFVCTIPAARMPCASVSPWSPVPTITVCLCQALVQLPRIAGRQLKDSQPCETPLSPLSGPGSAASTPLSCCASIFSAMLTLPSPLSAPRKRGIGGKMGIQVIIFGQVRDSGSLKSLVQ